MRHVSLQTVEKYHNMTTVHKQQWDMRIKCHHNASFQRFVHLRPSEQMHIFQPVIPGGMSPTAHDSPWWRQESTAAVLLPRFSSAGASVDLDVATPFCRAAARSSGEAWERGLAVAWSAYPVSHLWSFYLCEPLRPRHPPLSLTCLVSLADLLLDNSATQPLHLLPSTTVICFVPALWNGSPCLRAQMSTEALSVETVVEWWLVKNIVASVWSPVVPLGIASYSIHSFQRSHNRCFALSNTNKQTRNSQFVCCWPFTCCSCHCHWRRGFGYGPRMGTPC